MDGALAVSLEEFGLSRYEAQAYVALVSMGTASAGELRYRSRIPRTKIYPTMAKLEEKGLAAASRDRPVTYSATAPEDAFDPMIHEQIERVNAMNSLVSELKKAGEEGRRSSGSEEKRHMHLSAGAVPGRLQSMIDGARSTVRIAADPWGLGLVAGCAEQLASARRRGVEARVLVPPAQVGTENFGRIPAGVEVRCAEVAQNFFSFDGTELLMVDGSDGRAAVFPSEDILGACQERAFASAWRNASRTAALADMTRAEAQEIYRMIRAVGDSGLPYVLGAAASKRPDSDMSRMLEKAGVRIRSRPIDEAIEMVDAALQITCSGRANFEAGSMNVTIESRLNGGHSLPWASVLEGCLRGHGYKTRSAYQGGPRGERVHIRISK